MADPGARSSPRRPCLDEYCHVVSLCGNPSLFSLEYYPNYPFSNLIDSVLDLFAIFQELGMAKPPTLWFGGGSKF